MKRLLIVLALVLPLSLFVSGPAAAAPAERATEAQQLANQRLGTRLVTRFWDLLVAGDPDDLRAFLSPAFQVQRANGSGQNRNQYIASFAKSTTVVSDYALSRIIATRAGSLLVVRYFSQTTQTISGTPYSTAAAPRIVSFVQTPNGWRMASNANFNAP